LPDFYFESERNKVKDKDKNLYRSYIPIEAVSLLNFCGIWDREFVNKLEPMVCVIWR